MMLKKTYISIIISSLLFLSCNPEPEEGKTTYDLALTKACDYVQGGGKGTTGGKGGTVYVVTTLEDKINEANNKAEPGTLRHALEEGAARLVIFKVSGIIHLKKPLTITRGNITIAGQSAPGDGICIADYPLIIKSAENIIVRFVRLRMGDTSGEEYDALSVNNCRNVVIDHCSFSWSTDECVSCYGNENFTLQYCFITESLRNSVHLKGNHGYGGIWGGTNASFHHNLIAHHDSRNPRFDHDYVDNTCHGPIDFVNNVIYNWGSNSGYGGESVKEPRKNNMVANYYKYGPATNSNRRSRIVGPTTSCTNCVSSGVVTPGLFYVEGNYVYGSESVTNDNWQGVEPDDNSLKGRCVADTRFTMINEIQSETALEAYETVLEKAGCSLKRDVIDERIVEEVRSGKSTYKGSNGSTGGLIDSQKDVGGWPEYVGESPKDTDGDGIPDEWEIEHGLNPKSYADSREQTLVENHTNLEVYLNSLVAHLY